MAARTGRRWPARRALCAGKIRRSRNRNAARVLLAILPGVRNMRLIERLREESAMRSESLRQRVQFAADRVFGHGRALVESKKIRRPQRPALDRDTWRE